MAPPHPRPAGRVGAARAARFLCVAALGSGGLWLAAVRAGGACRIAGGDRLVDGRIWAHAAHRRQPFPPRDPFRSEERSVVNECVSTGRSRGSRVTLDQKKKSNT